MAKKDENPQEKADSKGQSKDEQKPDVKETPQEQPAEAAEQPEISQDSKNMAMLCHILGFLTSFIGPLVIWLIKKDEDSFVDRNGKEALNFQITVFIGMFAATLLTCICIGIPLLIAIPILDLIFCIIASVKASSGVAYRYPINIRFLK
ncbi:DUF4870 domain-containing protein [Planctomycetota bacterium]